MLDGGMQTTIQDGGRPGYLSRGIPPAGAQDFYSLALANLLVGNELTPPPLSRFAPGAAGLEMLMKGVKLRFREDAVIALAGAEMGAKLDGVDVPRFQPIAVKGGSELHLGVARAGARGYLAVAGGFNVPRVLGSRATYVRGTQGGLEGRALRKGDLLRLVPASGDLKAIASRRVPAGLPTTPDEPRVIRVVLGPQDFMFTERGVQTFLTAEWKLSPVSDRMGMRLIGPPLELHPRPSYLTHDAGAGPADIVDDVIPVGGIEPIVMGVENPTAGGYAKIATVISADLGKMGQLKPGEILTFCAVEAAEGLGVIRRLWKQLCDARDALAEKAAA
ncbi:biotin-dependent carboxyltransferase family protein [Mesorhizobium sp. IMUNJ 23232]|uniref:biotin-dependent carboxyltransferase family protein n=1 Tax=Mesorhizobium sp. IMUNJ 23232 TaxID=3376064 RepID=UPI00379AFC88